VYTYKNGLKNMISNRGLYRVWLESQDGGITRLASLWIDPTMQEFEPHAVLRETDIGVSPVLFSDDEPPSWNTSYEEAIASRGRTMVHEKSRKIAVQSLCRVETIGCSFT